MKLRKPEFPEAVNIESEKVRREPRFGAGWIVVYALAAVSFIIYIISLFSDKFSDFFTRYPAAFVRGLLAHITNLLPISLAECMLIFLVPACVAMLIVACRWHCGSWKSVWCYVGKLLSVIMVIFTLFVWTFATGYRGSSLGNKLGIDRQDVSRDELFETAETLIGLVNESSAEITFEDKSFSDMPYDISEMNDRLLAAYDKISDSYKFIPRLNSHVKPVMMSELMSYTHITGVYSFFTGEANINVVFPDYTIPYTAAHELAHQRGVAPEDEANFVAFLVCSASDDAYIRYSGYLNMLEYVLDACYTADASEEHADYRELYKKLNVEVRYERRAYVDFYQKYADNIAADVSGVVNDTFLKVQGTAGSVSYGMVVDYAVAYYKTHTK